MNTTLDQAAMTDLLGGFAITFYGAWKKTGVSSSFSYGPKHMGRKRYYGFRKWRRSGHQHATKYIRVKYLRSVRQIGWG